MMQGLPRGEPYTPLYRRWHLGHRDMWLRGVTWTAVLSGGNVHKLHSGCLTLVFHTSWAQSSGLTGVQQVQCRSLPPHATEVVVPGLNRRAVGLKP